MYSPDMMDCESDIQSLHSIQSPSNISAQSPATMAAQIDTSFVAKHNITAEAYQLFKDDVDLIFSGSLHFKISQHY
jgi:hypothetical protein